MTMICVEASSVRCALAEARRLMGVTKKDSREILRSGGEDGLYRVHLSNGAVVEATIKWKAKTVGEIMA